MLPSNDSPYLRDNIKLIHKKHAEILNHFLADNSVEIFYVSVTEDERNLIKVDVFMDLFFSSAHK